MIVPHHVSAMLQRVRTLYFRAGAETRMQPDKQSLESLRSVRSATAASIQAFWRSLHAQGHTTPADEAMLADAGTLAAAETYARNIENMIGTVKVPVGVVGPLRVRGLQADGDFYLPLATTEAALVASYHRGCALIGEAGGCTAMLHYETVGRSPAFAFPSLADAGRVIAWIVGEVDRFKAIAAGTTRHGELIDRAATFEGNHVYLTFEFSTGDA